MPNETTPPSTEIVKVPEQVTPMSMLAIAVQQGADIDKLTKLMDLQERWEKREAEKAFVVALAAFKENPPEITKNKKVSYETKSGTKTEYKHATLDRVSTSIGSALAKHGLSARWRTAQENGKIRVTCILQHQQGHSETTALEAPADDSGSKNAVQAIASTVTYLERYTLLAAAGMATADDSDGITFGDAEDMVNSLNSAADLDELRERFNKVYKRAFAAKDKNAMAIAIETKNKRMQEITGVSPSKLTPASEESIAQGKAIEDFHAKWEARGVNKANRHMMLGKHNGDMAAADKELTDLQPPQKGEDDPRGNSAEKPAKRKKGQTQGASTDATQRDETPKSSAAPEPAKPAEATEQERLGF